MSESFFRRWARRKAETAQSKEGADSTAPVRMSDADASDALAGGAGSTPSGQSALPSMKDIASLAPDADYSAFLAKGVDKAVRRAAMKKLFSDPHFNVMDGLDIYIGDYNKPSPLPPGMLAALQHAKSTLDPKPLYKTQEDEDNERRERELTGQDDESVESDAPGEAPPDEHKSEAKADGAAFEHPAQAQAPSESEEPQLPWQVPAQGAPINSTEFPPP